MKKALLIAAAITTAVITPLNSAVEARTRLSGAGASFPAKIYTRWFKDLATEGGPRVNYQAVGSGSGRKAFIDQTVNFVPNSATWKPSLSPSSGVTIPPPASI